ncbi:hypothetical protein C8J57DRAFT_1470939 [Mycena rebaudengoi]|nr:hypothetical protein C8J57DRAFT_1470939 [Mycena rebaudengoi]
MVGVDGTKSGFVAAAGNRMTAHRNQSLSGEKKSVKEHDEKSLCLMPGEIGRHRNEGEMYVRENIRMQMEPGAEREARVEKAESCSDSRSETGHSYGGRRKEGHTTRDEKMWGLVKIRDLSLKDSLCKKMANTLRDGWRQHVGALAV